MGDRATITIYQEGQDTPLNLYTHWRGDQISEILAQGLQRAALAGRLNDSPYATRIIFDTLTGLDGESTGYGIVVGDWDDINYPSPVLIFEAGKEPIVRYNELECTAHQWIDLFAESNIVQIDAIDLQPGMVYRRLPSHDWATVDSISHIMVRSSISGVKVNDVGGGGMTAGWRTVVYVNDIAASSATDPTGD